MDDMDDPSLFNEAWLDGLSNDSVEIPAENAAQGGQAAAGRQISPVGTECLDHPDDFELTGTQLDDFEMQFNTEAELNENLLTYSDPSFLPDQNLSAYPFKFSMDSYNNDSVSQDTTSGVNMNNINMGSFDERPYQSVGDSSQIDTGQPYHTNFIDFDVQGIVPANTGFFQQPLPGPTAPLSPALTPPPTSSKSPNDVSTFLQTNDQRWQATLDRSQRRR